AEAQYFAEHREGMGSGRTRTVAQNLITTVVLELGHFIIKPSAMRGVADIDAVLTKQLASLDGERAALSEKLDALSAGKLTEGERDELLAKLQALYARDVAFLDDAMRRGVKAPALRAAIAAYEAQIAAVELKLARAGVGSDTTGPQIFRQLRPGVIVWKTA